MKFIGRLLMLAPYVATGWLVAKAYPVDDWRTWVILFIVPTLSAIGECISLALGDKADV